MTSSSASSCSSSGAVTTTTAAVDNTPEDSRFSIGSTVRVCVPTPLHSNTPTTGGNSNDGSSNSGHITLSRRAIVATLSKETLSLVLDDLAPRPLVRGASPFLIAPLFRSRGRAVEEFECRVEDVRPLLPFELEEGFGGSGGSGGVRGRSGGRSDAMETSSSLSSSSFQLRQLALLRKSHGDELFRRKDYSSAIGYYEAALGVLSAKSRLAVGASCVARRKGRAAVAEVDCVERRTEEEEQEQEEEGETMVGGAMRIRQETVKYDVTYLDEEGMPHEEDCISDKDVILAIWDDDGREEQREMEMEQCDEHKTHNHARFLQVRILLNLSRSLLRLASADRTRGSGSCFGDRPPSSRSSPPPSNRRDKYLSSAIVGCTAAISLCRYHRHRHRQHGRVPETLLSESTSLELTALLIRANAHFEMGFDQFPKAMRDARRIVEAEGQSHPDRHHRRRQAVEVMNKIESAKKHRRRLDKKLSRDVCRWVQTSMAHHDTAQGTGRAGDDDEEEEEEFSRSSDGNTSSAIHGGSNDDTVRTSGTDSVSASDDSGGGGGIHDDDGDDHNHDDHDEDDNPRKRWDRPSDSISGRRKRILPSRDDGMHSCDGDRSGNFFWVSKRRIDVDVVGVLAFLVAMWIVYSQ